MAYIVPRGFTTLVDDPGTGRAPVSIGGPPPNSEVFLVAGAEREQLRTSRSHPRDSVGPLPEWHAFSEQIQVRKAVTSASVAFVETRSVETARTQNRGVRSAAADVSLSTSSASSRPTRCRSGSMASRLRYRLSQTGPSGFPFRRRSSRPQPIFSSFPGGISTGRIERRVKGRLPGSWSCMTACQARSRVRRPHTAGTPILSGPGPSRSLSEPDLRNVGKLLCVSAIVQQPIELGLAAAAGSCWLAEPVVRNSGWAAVAG